MHVFDCSQAIDDLVDEQDGGIVGISSEMCNEGIFSKCVDDRGEEGVGHREGVLRNLSRVLVGC